MATLESCASDLGSRDVGIWQDHCRSPHRRTNQSAVFRTRMLAFGPDWSRPDDFVESVEEIVAGPAWVIDSWGDEQVRDAMWAAADTVVWLDYRARVVIPSLLRRSLLRSATRVEIFNGNRETWLGWLKQEAPGLARPMLVPGAARLSGRSHTSHASRHLRTLRFLCRSDFEHWLAELVPESTSR